VQTSQLPDIIGVTGYAQHGKDSLGQYLVDHYGYTRLAFADSLKQMALVLNPLIMGYSYQDHMMFQSEDEEQSFCRLAGLVDQCGWETAKTVPEVRRFLQVLGTEAVRDILGQDSWVDALWLKVIPGGKYVITDARFPNEVESIRAMYGQVVRVSRVNEDGSPFENGVDVTHPSEAHIASLPVDVDLVASNLDQLFASFEAEMGL
jgi:hypothetical protein